MVQRQQQSLDGVICMCYFIQSLWSQNNVIRRHQRTLQPATEQGYIQLEQSIGQLVTFLSVSQVGLDFHLQFLPLARFQSQEQSLVQHFFVFTSCSSSDFVHRHYSQLVVTFNLEDSQLFFCCIPCGMLRSSKFKCVKLLSYPN